MALGCSIFKSLDNWNSLVVNTVAPFFLVQGLTEELKASSGHVINISSIHAKLTKKNFTGFLYWIAEETHKFNSFNSQQLKVQDGEFVTKSKAVRGAGIAMGANPNDKQEQRTLGARFFYKQMADFDKLAKRMSS